MDPMPRLLSGSAVGFYGDTGDRLTDEQGPNGDDFLSGIVREWEAAARPAVDAGASVAFLRSGVVLSTKGGFLHQVLPFFKAALGGRSKSGRQYISWISITDEVQRHRAPADVRRRRARSTSSHRTRRPTGS